MRSAPALREHYCTEYHCCGGRAAPGACDSHYMRAQASDSDPRAGARQDRPGLLLRHRTLTFLALTAAHGLKGQDNRFP